MIQSLAVVGTSLAGGSLNGQPSRVQDRGFIGELDFRAIEIAGEMRFELKRDFGYVDSSGVRWQAKAGLLTDGASIPPAFWSLVGHPYQGLYLKAAVVHDYYCIPQNRYRKWQDVHRVFYDGMMFAGVGKTKAMLMYFAVWRFGPRWKVEEIKPCTPRPDEFCASSEVVAFRIASESVAGFNVDDEYKRLRAIERRIESENIDADSIGELEAHQPALPRSPSTLEVKAGTEQGWFFKNPYGFPLTLRNPRGLQSR
jgi:hypothetical protein